jgi:cytochrome c oxidase assembly factor CtaG
MPSAVDDVLRTWSVSIPVTLALVLTSSVYAIGWYRLRRASDQAIGVGHLAAFGAGMVALGIAVGSPLEAFAEDLLSAHMVQHLLLMSVAPPLILLGAPVQPILHGLPSGVVRGVVGPLLRLGPVKWLGQALATPWLCWLAGTGTLIGWHLPVAFEFALRSEFWHDVEHVCFVATSLMFWWPVVLPRPSVERWPRWTVPLYLFLGMLGNDALSAFLTFCDRVLYPSYASAPRFSISPLEDQALSGAIMWASGTFVFLVPAVVVSLQILSPPGARQPGHHPGPSATLRPATNASVASG